MKNKLTIISDTNIESAGVVTYWNLTRVKYSMLVKAVKSTRLGLKLPNMPTQGAALKRALSSACGAVGADLFVRPFPGGQDQFMVVRQEGAHLCRILHTKFEIDDHGNRIPEFLLFPEVPIDFSVQRLAGSIRPCYEEEIDTVPAAEFGNWLISVIEAAPFNALRLRENGGVYFIPHASRAAWDLLTDSICDEVDAKCVFHELPTVRSEEAAFAVTAALTESINQTVASIRSELESGSLKTRALGARADEAKSLLLRVQLYEQTLGVQLDDLVKLCHGLEISVATATLAAQAEASTP